MFKFWIMNCKKLYEMHPITCIHVFFMSYCRIISVKWINQSNMKKYRIYWSVRPLGIYLHRIARCKAVVYPVSMKGVYTIVYLFFFVLSPDRRYSTAVIFALRHQYLRRGISTILIIYSKYAINWTQWILDPSEWTESIQMLFNTKIIL